MTIDAVIDVLMLALLLLLAVTGLGLMRLRNLVGVVMLAGLFSLLCAVLYTTLDAVDVAFIEAAVGAGVVTVLLLTTLARVGWQEKQPTHRPLLPLIIVLVTGSALIYSTTDIPPFGDPANPAHHHVAPRYLEISEEEIGIPNVVTSVLASYRGYDTLGETTVIFTAVVAVLLLLATGPRPRRTRKRSSDPDPEPEVSAQERADG